MPGLTAEVPDGLVAVVREECATCTMVAPLLADLPVHVISEDDDRGLETSYGLGIETVPTLLRVVGGREIERLVGWQREDWRRLSGNDALGANLPEWRPGCGSRTLDPGVADDLEVRFRGGLLRSRRVELAGLEDEAEAMFDRGWTDGLPVVAPTEARVLRMLRGTTRPPEQVVGVLPPDLVECTVEKVAVNAVLAGCKPEYLPVVLAAVEAACTDEFNAHGLAATTFHSGPVVVVNGPVRGAIGMNAGVNVLGQATGPTPPSGGRCSWFSATSAEAVRAGSTGRCTATRASTPSASPRTRRGHRGSRCRSVAGPMPARPQ